MALLRNSIAALLLTAAPALADDFDYMSRGDYIELSNGDASQSNITIHSPTPWPSYVNDVHIHTPARQGISAMEKMFNRYGASSASAPSTVINVGVK